jgi:putative ABC transport system permease protein
MRWLYKLPLRLRSLFQKSHVEQDLTDELRFHLEKLIDEYVAKGMTREEAHYAALRELGGVEQIKEECRDMRRVNHIENFLQDIRYGLRQLRRNPGFTAVAILTLALGIGVNTAVFSLVDEVWLRPRPTPHPERIVRIYTSNPSSEGEIARGESSYLDYYYVSRGVKSLSGVALLQRRGAMLDMHGESKLLDVAVVSDNFFDVLEPTAAAGHVLTAAQAGAPGALTVMFSYPFWNDQFNADPTLPGKTIALNHQHVTVAGVLPRGFHDTEPTATADIWIPLSTWSELTGERPTLARGTRDYSLFGRLRPDASLRQANAELAVIAAGLAREHPETNAGRKMMCLRESQVQGEGVRGFSLILLAISGLVLLIACVNVASLLIARAEHRRHEFAMRSALGASRRRLLRQLLTEALLLGAAATAAALVIGGWVDALLPKVLPQLSFTTPVDAHMTPRVLYFSLAAGILSVLAFDTIPARQGSRNSSADILKQYSRSATSRTSVRSVLVVGQVAISLVLVVAAGLLVRSLRNAEAANPGFDAHQNMLVLDFATDCKTQQAYRAFVEEARHRIEAIPGVLGTAVAMRIPFGLSGAGATQKVFFAGATGRAATDGIPVGYDPVSDNFFQMMGTGILRGRAIDAHDLQTDAHVMMINRTMAQRFWSGEDPIGQYVRLQKADGDRYEVVGVAQDSKNEDFVEAPTPYFYTPMGLGDYGELEMVVKTGADPSSIAGPVRHTLLSLDQGLTIVYFKTLREHVRLAMADQRISAELIASLGALGLLLAAVGLYGLTSYLVRSRTQEIGIRMALGATRASILRLVMARALALTSVGLAIGLAGAFGVTGALRALLFGVAPHNVFVFAVATAVLALVTCTASFVPALRATRVNPTEALHYE